MAGSPKTGVRRKTRQPFAIDKLPADVRDKIQQLRAGGATWEEIEEQSEEFAGRRLAKSTLQRWYDVRVEQVLADAQAREDRARAIAEGFAGKGVKELPAVIVNALTAKIFTLMEAADDKSSSKVIGALTELGHLVAKFEKLGLEAGKLGVEREKLQLMAAKVKGLKSEVAKRKLAPAELQKKLDEIYGIVENNPAA